MVRRLLLIAAVALLPSQLLGQTVLNFPRIVSSADAVTSISVVNPTSQEVSITLTAFESSGSPLVIAGVSNPFTATIPAGGNYSRPFTDIYRANSFNGWLQVTSAASGLTGFALNSNPANTDVDGTIAIEPASEFTLPFAAEDSTVRTELTLVNVNNDPAQATLTLYGADGTALGTKSLSLASKALLRQTLVLVFADVDLSAASHVKVRSDRPLAGLEVVADFQIPGITLRRETVALAAQRGVSDLAYVVPQFATGTTFTSYLRVVNGSGVSQEVTLTAYKEDGTPFSGGTNPRQEVIPGNASLRVSVADYFGLPSSQVSTGWIEIRGSVGYLSVGLGYGSTLTPSFAMTAAVPVGGASRTQVHNYLAETATFSTALSLVNAGAASAGVDVFVLRTDGSTVGRAALTLGSKQHLSRLLRELVPGSRDLSGAWVIVRADAPIVSALYVSSANGAAFVGVAPQPLTSDFIPPPQTTASISGIASQDGRGVENATVRLTGPVTATKTTDSSGRYVFGQLPPGNYIVAVSKPGVQFFPPERAVTLARENLDAIHFLAVGIAPAAIPSISLLSPTSVFGAGSALSVTVFGSGFNPASRVYLNGEELQTSYISTLELHAVVPANLLQKTGVLAVSVLTEPPGGGTSNRLDFTVNEIPVNPLIEGRLDVGKFPAGVAIDEGMSMVVVSNESDDNVSLVHLRTLERLGTAVAGRSPAEGIAIHERTKRAFVGNAGSDTVSVIDLNTRAEIMRIPVGRFPIGIAVSDVSDRVFVANGESNSVSVIDANSLTVVNTIPVGSRPGGIAVTPTGSHAVVSNRADDTVSIVDLNSGAVVGTVSVGQHPRGVAFDAQKNLAIVVNAGSNNVTMIDIAKGANVGGFPVGTAPTAIAIHAGSHSAVITNSGATKTTPKSGLATSVSIVNLDDYSTVEVPVEAQAFGVAIDQQGQRAFVVNFGSNSVTVVRIPNPQPKIDDVSPKTFPVGGGSFTITVRGTGFLPTSVVTLNGKSLPTKYISPTELQAEVTPELLDELLLQITPIQTGGEKGTFAQVVTLDFKIEVTNPGPGGGGSPPPKDPDAGKIEPLNATPLLNSITPASTEVDKDVVITLIGNNFSATSVINFGGNPHSPTTVEPTQMTLRIPAAELRAGDVPVSVTNPPPGGGTSDVFPFRVLDNTNPVPSVSSVVPPEVAAGASSVNVAIDGAGFIAATTVNLGGVVVPVTVVASNRIEFSVGAALLRNAESLAGLVANPLPGGGTASFSLSVSNPVPSVTTFSPNIVDAGSVNIELQIKGARFVESSSVVVAGTPVPTRFVSAGEIRATLSEALLKTPGKVKIGVSNPAPGGGVADAGTLTVEQAAPLLESLSPGSIRVDQKDVTVTLAGRNFVNGAKVLVGTVEVTAVFVSSTQLRIVLPALAIGNATIAVKNPGAAGKLSNSLGLQITAGIPVLTSLTPSNGVAGLPATVRVQGSNFTAQSVLTLGGVVVPAIFVSGSILDAVFTPATPGVHDVVVSNPGVVGGVSNARPYTVVGAPTINTLQAAIPGLVPETVAAESGELLLTINGVNFYDDAVITFGSTNLIPKTLSPTAITVQIPASLTLVPGAFGVTVRARGAVSNAVAFTVGKPDVTMSIAPAGPLTFGALGLTEMLTATAKTTGGNVVPVEIVWTSSNTGVVTVNEAGVVTSVGNGEATVVATADGLFGSVAVTVAQIVNSVEVSPASAALTSIGATAQFSAIARDSNGRTVADKTIVWSSDGPSTATVNSSGLVAAVANGTTALRAVVDGKQGTASVSVGQTVSTVEVSPASATLNSLNITQTYTAVAKDAKGVVISGKTFEWSSSTAGIASLSATSGVASTVATAAGNGNTSISASVDGKTGSASLAVNQIVASVEVVTDTPGVSTTLTSLAATLQLRAVVRDASNQTIGGKTVAWESESPTKASVSSTGQVTALANGSAVIRATVGDKSGTLPVSVGQTVDSLTISPTSKTLTSAGEKQRFTGTLKDANGNTVAGTITWSSSAAGVATIAVVDAASADATAVGNGTTTITASASGKSATATVTVNQTVGSVEVAPSSKTLTALGATFTFTATVKDGLGNTVIGQPIAWESTSSSVATINASTGLAAAVANGSTTIKATVGGKTGMAQLIVAETIEPPVINSLSATPVGLLPSTAAAESDDFTLTINGTKFRGDATVTFGSTTLTPKTVTFTEITVEVPTALILSPGALAVTVTAGAALSNAVSFTVGNPVVDVTIAPSDSVTFAALGLTQTFTATAKTTGGTVIAKVFNWTSSNTSVASVNSAGLVTAVGNGTAIVVATADGLSGSVAVTVAQIVNSVEVSPSSATFASIGATAQFSAVVKDSNGQTIAGKTIAWSSDATATATIDSSGLATAGAANGTTTTLRASVDGKQGTAAITVSQTVATVEVSPPSATLASLNLTQTFTAVAKDAKGVAISGKTFSWTSSTAGIASLSATTGVVSTVATAAGNGNTSIEASLDGKTGPASLTVSQVVANVQVVTDPAGASTTLTSFGATLQLRAVVKDGNGQTITGKNIAWVSESPSAAGVSSAGQVTALANGSAVIRATVEDQTATLSVTVGQVVDSLTITPASPAPLASKGDKQRFTGTLKDANGNPMAGTITWSSSSTGVATIASLDALNADATAVANGTTTITATGSGKTATATLSVNVVVATIELSPLTKTLDALTDTFTFTPTVKDNQGNVVTGQTIAWESSSPSVATVHPSTGLVTSIAEGSTTIKATVGGKTATAQLIVAQEVDSFSVEPGDGAPLSVGNLASRNGVHVQVFAVSSVPTLASLGDERTFRVVAKDRKGNTILGRAVSWTSSRPDFVTVDSIGKVRAVGNGTARITAALGSKTGFVDQTVDQAVDSIVVSPNSATLTSLEDTVPLRATLKDARGNAIGKSLDVTWASSNSAAAAVNGGLVTAVAEGSGIAVTATANGKTGSATIVVRQEVATISVSPERRHFNLRNDRQPFTAIAKDARGRQINGRGRSWVSNHDEIAEVNDSGDVTSRGNGSAVISVTIDGKTTVATVTVAENAARIEIDQESVFFEGLKSTKPLVARFFDALNNEITKGIAWSSSKPEVATISGAGVLTAESNGVTTITATADGISASISVRVNQKLHRIVITQVGSGKLRALGRKRQFIAKAVDPNGFEIPGKAPKWKSSDNGKADVNEGGEATGKRNGRVTITAEIEGITETAELEIDQVPDRIEHVSGSGKLKAFKRSRQLRVLDEDGNPIADKTVSWSSTDDDVALVDSNGVAKSNRKNGNAKVRATVDGVTVETDLDVDQDIASIEISADGAGRVPALNRKRKFTAIGKDPDGSVVVDKSVEWLTSDGSIGSIDSDGNATAKKNGKVQIRAKIGDLTSGPIDFEISQVTKSVTVTASSSGKVEALNRKRPHTAVARDEDGYVIEGKTATWSSSRSDLATVDSNGEVTAKGNGKSTIKAVIDGVEGSLEFETDQRLSAVVSHETGKVKALNRTRQYRAADPDGYDIKGKDVIWSTSDGTTASVDSKGVSQAKKNGTARITATVGGQTASSDLEILQEVASVTISTSESGKITKFRHTRRSTAVVKDADGYEITGRTVTWYSTDASITIDSATGDAESTKNGSSKISAIVDEVKSNDLTFEVLQGLATVEPKSGESTGKFKSMQESRKYVAKDANGDEIKKGISWSVVDSGIAFVSDEGEVLSVGNGKTSVSATVDGVTVSVAVEVEQVAVKVEITVNKREHLSSDTTREVNLEATGFDAAGIPVGNKTIELSVDNPSIATITGNKVTAGKGIKGTITVTARMDDAPPATIDLKVE